MRVMLGVLGVLQICVGILIYLFAKFEIHEVVGSISFGMGVMAIGVSGVVALLEKQLAISAVQASPKRHDVSDNPLSIRNPYADVFERPG